MANPSKAKGTRAETNVVNYLNYHGLRAERRPLAGSADQGDLRVIMPNGTEVTAEVKAGKQTQNYPRSRVEDWRSQTLEESRNSGCPMSMLVIVRYKRRLRDTEIWLPNFQWFNVGDPGWTMMYLDQFVRWKGEEV